MGIEYFVDLEQCVDIRDIRKVVELCPPVKDIFEDVPEWAKIIATEDTLNDFLLKQYEEDKKNSTQDGPVGFPDFYEWALNWCFSSEDEKIDFHCILNECDISLKGGYTLQNGWVVYFARLVVKSESYSEYKNPNMKGIFVPADMSDVTKELSALGILDYVNTDFFFKVKSGCDA